MRRIRIALYFLLSVGVVILLSAAITAVVEWRFLSRATSAVGRVVGERESTSSSDGKLETHYCAVVSFTGPLGAAVQVQDAVCSNHPIHDIGRAVPVLFDPAHPERAQVDSFANRWVVSLILLAMGIAFAGGALIPLAIMGRRRSLIAWLRANGKRVEARFIRAEQNTSIRFNGRSPYRLVAQWVDPETNKLYVMQSENIWFDPAPFMAGRNTVDAVLDPKDPRRHFVDLSFLPELAE